MTTMAPIHPGEVLLGDYLTPLESRERVGVCVYAGAHGRG